MASLSVAIIKPIDVNRSFLGFRLRSNFSSELIDHLVGFRYFIIVTFNDCLREYLTRQHFVSPPAFSFVTARGNLDVQFFRFNAIGNFGLRLFLHLTFLDRSFLVGLSLILFFYRCCQRSSALSNASTIRLLYYLSFSLILIRVVFSKYVICDFGF